MKNHKKQKNTWTTFIIFWVILLFIYESPNILCFSYEKGLYQSDINDILNVNVRFKDGWCPSIEDVLQNDILGNKQSQFIYVNNHFFKPWDFSNFLIFSQPNYNNEVVEVRNLYRESEFPWGIAYIVGQDAKGFISVYSKDSNIQISTPDIKLLNEIIKLN